MAEVIKMPRLSDTMEEGRIVEWLKKEGDQIAQGDVLAEVETDKANMELESFYEGTLLYIGVGADETVPVDAVLAVVGEKGEDYQKVLEEAKKGEESSKPSESSSSESEETSKKEQEAETPKAPEAEPSGQTGQVADLASVLEKGKKGEDGKDEAEQRIKASPLAKRLAKEKGIDIAQIEGTGDGGRIIKRDIERAEAEGIKPQKTKSQSSKTPTEPVEAIAGTEDYEDKSISQMRKTIAKRLVESKFTAPHFYLTMEINMDNAIEARKRINEVAEDKVSFNDLIVKASALALRKNPQANASWLGDKIRYYKHIHMGVAVAVEEGLVVPVIRFADQKGVSQISAETKHYAKKAQDKTLQPEDYQGNTFTISNLGMYGIEEFTAIINPPDACILAVGKISQKPVIEEGDLKETNRMKVTLSCDHRVVDGAIGSGFLNTFKSLMEDPLRMIL